MKAAAFDYHAPATIDEALVLLHDLDAGAKLIAGGLSLVPSMLARVVRPAHLIDINRLSRAELPSVEGDRLIVPPLMRNIDFEAIYETEGPLEALLAALARRIVQLPIRLRGTFCGALANAHPASHWSLAALVLDAEMIARSSRRGPRTVAAGEFFEGAFATSLQHDEMLVEVRLPLLPDDTLFGYEECVLRSGSYPLAMCLAVHRQGAPEMRGVRLGIGALEATPSRLREVEDLLELQTPSPRLFREAAELAASLVRPMASEEEDETAHRRDLTRAVVLRALERTLA